MKKVIIIAPHADDETLGVGGTILRHKAQQDEIYWLIVTGITQELGFSWEKIETRKKEIDTVGNLYQFNAIAQLNFPTTKLDILPMGDIIGKISQVFQTINPEIIYLPYPGDIHTDHKIVFDAVAACTKWFRYPSVKRVLAYETLSETDFNLNTDNNGFKPNVFVNISKYLDQKINIMKVYRSEMGKFPFPRSEEAIKALATLRGVASGFEAAESFILLKECF